jgi:hypothetical protein
MTELKDKFRPFVYPHQYKMLDCKLCGAPARLWQEWREADIWDNFVCCTGLVDVLGEPCEFHLPMNRMFYRERKTDAVKYWNMVMGPRPAPKGEDEYVANQMMWEEAEKLLGHPLNRTIKV